MLSRRLGMRSTMLAAVLLAGIGNGLSPAIPVDHRIEPTTRAAAPRRRFASRYPFASARQLSRVYTTVVGRNGHGTIRRVA
jgi:hypothetical protein